MSDRRTRQLLPRIALLMLVLATAAGAGTNAGFRARVSVPVVKDPVVGQQLAVPVMIEGAVKVKGGMITARYDSTVLTFDQFIPGTLAPGMMTLPEPPEAGTDGLMTVRGGGTQLSGTPGTGRGLLGTLMFHVSGTVPSTGTFLSITDVQIQASSSDKDVVSFALGTQGVLLTRTVYHTLSGTVRRLTGEPVVGAVVYATRNPGTRDEQTVSATSGEGGTYSLRAEQDTFVVVTVPPVTSASLKVTRAAAPVFLTQDRTLDLVLDEVMANSVYDVTLDRRHNAASLTWFTRLAGIDDSVRYRAEGETAWQTQVSPFRALAGAQLAVLQRFLLAGARQFTVAQLAAALGRQPTADELALLRELNDALSARRHTITVSGLLADTPYEFLIYSTSLEGQRAAPYQSLMQTRREPDRRQLTISSLDIQPSTSTALVRWSTNRSADTKVWVMKLGAGQATLDTVFRYSGDATGTQVHLVAIEGLEAEGQYRLIVTSTMPDGAALVQAQTMAPDAITARAVREFDSRRAMPLRFVGTPRRSIGPEEVRLQIALNQPATVVVHYGVVGHDSSQVTYTDSATGGEPLVEQEVNLTHLQATTEYRYRVTARLAQAVLAADPTVNTGEQITTDPRGNEQWSRDHQFRTAALTDVQPPMIIAGPQVVWRATTATIFWATDVPTTGFIGLGTWIGGVVTVGTADEYEIADLGPDGRPLLSQIHRVTIPALTPQTPYGYRLHGTAANGQTYTFNPLVDRSTAKAVRLAQPPGGAGRFTTNLNPDTQWPVITDGPTVTARTHDTAVIEWTTDEPADSEVGYRATGTTGSVTSGDDESQHKMVLTDLSPGSSYTYTVASTDPSGNGPTQSGEAAFTTNSELDLTPPAITQGPEVAYKSDRGATVRWVTDEDATGELEYGVTTSYGFVRAAAGTGQQHEVALTNLAAGTEYFVRVASADLSGNGPTLRTLQFTTDEVADLASPTLSGLRTTVGDVSAIVAWSTDEYANSYVEYGTDPAALSANVGDPADVLAHQITLTNLIPGTRYYFRAGSVDRANNPPAESALDSLVTLGGRDTTPPAVPTSLRGTAGNGRAVLTWRAVLELDLNGFNVYRRTIAGIFAKVASGVRDTSYADLSVTNGETYVYRVSAVDRQAPPNESARSDSVQVTPLASLAPLAPTGLQADATNHLQPTLRFTNATPITAGATLTYTIQVSTAEDFSNVTASVTGLAQGTGGQTSWQLTRVLNEGSTYYWRVRAVEGAQVGAYTAAQVYTARQVVALPGDFDDSGTVDFSDFFMFVDVFGQTAVGALAAYDLDGGGNVDFSDFFIFVDNFGRSASGKTGPAMVAVEPRTGVSLEAQGGLPRDRGQVRLRVSANGLPAVRAFGLVLTYNPAAVEFISAAAGDQGLLATGGGTPLFQVLAQRPGEITLGGGTTAGATVAGSGLLAELRFRTVGLGNDARFAIGEALLARSGAQVSRVEKLGHAVLLPQVSYLRANYPNPFNPSTTIEYGLAGAGPVDVAVFDLLGQRVRTLLRLAAQPAGFYSVTWDGLDQAGRSVGSGVYFCRLTAPTGTQIQRMTLLK
jgi:hypothetical protein